VTKELGSNFDHNHDNVRNRAEHGSFRDEIGSPILVMEKGMCEMVVQGCHALSLPCARSGRSEDFKIGFDRIREFISSPALCYWRCCVALQESSESDEWQGASALVVPAGEAQDDIRYWKSSSLYLWLLGYEFTDTVLVFTKTAIHALAGKKKIAILEQLKEACAGKGIELQLHLKSKEDGGLPQMKQIVEAIKASGESPVIGSLTKEKPSGSFAEAWEAAVGKSGVPVVDVAKAVGSVLAVKDDDEVINVKKAAFLLTKAMEETAVKEIEKAADQDSAISHDKLSAKMAAVLDDPSKIEVRLKKDMVDMAYQPLFESGGEYSLKIGGESSEKPVDYGVIVCQAGARYASYCANVGRTYFINPTEEKKAKYGIALEAHAAAVKALVDGRKASDAYEAALKVLQEKDEAMASKLGKNVGTSIGLEIRDNTQALSASNQRIVKAGMTFNVVLALNDLVDSEKEGDRYALLLADTVLVGEKTETLTGQVKKDWNDIAYYLGDEEEEQEASEEDEPAEERQATRGVRKSARTEHVDFKEREEERRRQKESQEALLEKVNQATLNILDKKGGTQGSEKTRNVTDIVSYKSASDVRQVHHLSIHMDNKSESVLLPIYGVMVPFHILTIKNASATQENEHYFIRINFNFGPQWQPGSVFPKKCFVKEMSFRTANGNHATSIVRDIKTLRSMVLSRDKEKAERATLVQQEKLILGKQRVVVLKDVWMRPAFVGKGRKMAGQLEAHTNGFRYKTPKGEELDVMYRNIKHAFFQPAENDMITLVHFHLIDPIMIGKKKTHDVQFYSQVMDAIQTLDAGRRSMYDPDEIEEEQRERERRNQINKEFSQFIKRVQQDIWERDFGDLNLEFEIPFRELGFHGVPARSTAFVMPTVNCLVELTEMPFTVIPLAEVNLVNLERVGFNLRNFDMIFVWKDFNKEVARIDSVPSHSLETIKDWMSSIEMKFFESKVNLNWKTILKTIKDDPEGFVDSGGWSFLDADAEDSDEEEQEEGSEFEIDEEGAGSESSDYSDMSDESLEEEDSDEDFAASDEEEEEGMDWDEMEQEARREDRERGYSDDEGPRKKRR